MSRFDAPTMDPTTSRATARTSMVLWCVYDGATRSTCLRAHPVDGETRIGRTGSAPGIIGLEDPRASREHARLVVTRTGVDVEDLSRHGTWVDGVRIQAQQRASLADRGVLRVGDTLFVLRREPTSVEDAEVPEIVGHAVEVRALRATLAELAPTRATALLLGPTGTGKEVAARAIHRLSGRTGAFVPVNCGAIPATLFESELFGHMKGAFTGADRDDPGLARAAAGGTLFLDEIGELPLEVQPKLLRFLDEGAVLAVGARKPLAVDVRLVAATHQDLGRAVAEGTFRGDLYARLAEIVVPLPPLAHRREDVFTLLARALRADAPPLHPNLAHALLVHPWPFNVREVMKIGSELGVKSRGHDVMELEWVAARLGAVAGDAPAPLRHKDAPDPVRDDVREPPPDAAALQALADEHGGNVSAIARATGRSRRQVRRWFEKLGLAIHSE